MLPEVGALSPRGSVDASTGGSARRGSRGGAGTRGAMAVQRRGSPPIASRSASERPAMTLHRRATAGPRLARWVHLRALPRPPSGLVRQVRDGAALGAVAGAVVGLVWLTFAHGPALGGPAVLGALAGLGAGGWWLWRAGPARRPLLG